MREFVKIIFLVLLLNVSAFGAAWTSQQTGDWSRTSDNADSPWFDGGAQTALAAVPANTDTVTIANTHTVTFDVDQSGFASGVTVTINAGGTLICDTAAGSYYLKCQADMNVDGTFQVGTSRAVPLPSGTTFTLDLGGNKKLDCITSTGRVYFYCLHPTNKIIKLNGGEAINSTVIDVDTDVTGDIWADGDDVAIIDINNAKDVEIVQIAGGGIAAGAITITGGAGAGGGLAAAKSDQSLMVLCNRNIKVINTSSNPAIYRPQSSIFDCELDNTLTGSALFSIPIETDFGGVDWAGQLQLTSTNYGFVMSGISCNHTSVVITNGINLTVSGTIAGNVGALSACTLINITGTMTGHSAYALSAVSGVVIQGAELYGNTVDIVQSTDITIGNMTLGSTTALNYCGSGRTYNTVYSGTEFSNYSAYYRPQNAYWESFDHDGTVNAYKAWVRGGVVTSQTASPPTGYTIWYKLTCEDTAQTYPCFRQYETVVMPGTSIEVSGYMAIPNGEDLSTSGKEPQLQIIDKFADPLVDSTQSPLDYDIPADVSGVTTTFQPVSVIWANQGDAPRNVIVRMIAYVDAGAGDSVEVSSAWSVADYKDQIAILYDTLIPVKTTVATADTTLSFTLTAGTATADIYNDMTLMVQDADDSHWELRSIEDWTAGRVITVGAAFGFTPAAGDKAYIMATSYGAPVDTAAIADSVWDEAVADHTTETSFGGEVGGLDPNVTSILADTNELQTDWTNGGRLDLLIDAIKYKTDLITIVDTVVKDANDANNFTIEDGRDVNDAYWFSVIMVTDADTSLSEVRFIDRYDENSGDPNVWVDEQFSFTPAANDVVHIMGTSYGGYLDMIYDFVRQSKAVINYINGTGSGSGGSTSTQYINREDDYGDFIPGI